MRPCARASSASSISPYVAIPVETISGRPVAAIAAQLEVDELERRHLERRDADLGERLDGGGSNGVAKNSIPRAPRMLRQACEPLAGERDVLEDFLHGLVDCLMYSNRGVLSSTASARVDLELDRVGPRVAPRRRSARGRSRGHDCGLRPLRRSRSRARRRRPAARRSRSVCQRRFLRTGSAGSEHRRDGRPDQARSTASGSASASTASASA